MSRIFYIKGSMLFALTAVAAFKSFTNCVRHTCCGPVAHTDMTGMAVVWIIVIFAVFYFAGNSFNFHFHFISLPSQLLFTAGFYLYILILGENMSLFAIADTHLSFGTNKPMDTFEGWSNYTQRLENNWNRLVGNEDYVIIAGDISWAMNFDELKADFAFIDSLKGKKIILKGNHDYWWNTVKKFMDFLI